MRDRARSAVLAVLMVLTATAASAQVGHAPERSPYLDLEYKQELTLLGGYARARHDPAGVAPQSFPAFGLRYEATVAGPLALGGDIMVGSTNRDVIDPLKPVATRHVGTQSSMEWAADFAGSMNLTGQRSWHSLVPQVRVGLGLVHNGAADDSSGFAVGTRFAFSWGGGVKYVRPGSRVQFRADVTDRLFKLDYTDAYYRVTSDNTTVLSNSTAKSFYTHHTFLTVGISYLFAR
jgi:hypothetical protein